VYSVIMTRLLFTYSSQCKFARYIWLVIHLGSTLYPPRSVADIFGNWLNGVDYTFKILLRMGAFVVTWSLWLYRNEDVFNDKNSSLIQFIYLCTAFLRSWSSLHRVKNRDLFMEVSTRLDDMVRDIFIQLRWQRNLVILHRLRPLGTFPRKKRPL
jgi:hypothetical protein